MCLGTLGIQAKAKFWWVIYQINQVFVWTFFNKTNKFWATYSSWKRTCIKIIWFPCPCSQFCVILLRKRQNNKYRCDLVSIYSWIIDDVFFVFPTAAKIISYHLPHVQYTLPRVLKSIDWRILGHRVLLLFTFFHVKEIMMIVGIFNWEICNIFVTMKINCFTFQVIIK